MKKIIKSIGALALGAMVFAMSPLSVLADEKSYTYNYDYWGDVQDSPDAYTVAGVYTAEAFGLDLNLRNPQECLSRRIWSISVIPATTGLCSSSGPAQ